MNVWFVGFKVSILYNLMYVFSFFIYRKSLFNFKCEVTKGIHIIL